MAPNWEDVPAHVESLAWVRARLASPKSRAKKSAAGPPQTSTPSAGTNESSAAPVELEGGMAAPGYVLPTWLRIYDRNAK